MRLQYRDNNIQGELSFKDNKLVVTTDGGLEHIYETLEDLWVEWCDVNNTMFYLYSDGLICSINSDYDDNSEGKKEVGNYFEIREEAEIAVKKLKAWKRIKDAGLLNSNWHYTGAKLVVEMEFAFDVPILDDDLNMVFKK